MLSPKINQYITENASVLTDKQISAALGKSLASVRKARQRLGIKKVCGRGRCQVCSTKEDRPGPDGLV